MQATYGLQEELEPVLVPRDTVKGRWLSEASQQSRKASRFAAREVQERTHHVEEELEPVLNKDDLNQGGSLQKQSQFGRRSQNLQNTEEEDEEDDNSWSGQAGHREYGMEQGQGQEGEGSQRQYQNAPARDRILSEKLVSCQKTQMLQNDADFFDPIQMPH